MSDATEKQSYETPRVERISTSLDTETGPIPEVFEAGSNCGPPLFS